MENGQIPGFEELDPGEETVEGRVQRFIFRNEDASFVVARVNTANGQVTVTGPLAGVLPGQYYTFAGEWRQHYRYGLQFQAWEAREMEPNRSQGIRAYLASGLVPGVGENLAGRLVEHFGEETLDVIKADPGRLAEVPGLGKDTARRVQEALEDNREMEEALVFLQSYGVSASMALKAFRRFREETVEAVQEDPYQLLEEVSGIGFGPVDRMARHLGFSPQSQGRLQAALRQALEDACWQQGHSFLGLAQLFSRAAPFLALPGTGWSLGQEEMEMALEGLVQQGTAVVQGEAVFLGRPFQAEQELAQLLLEKVGHASGPEEDEVLAALDAAQGAVNFAFSPQQLEVLRRSLEQSLLVVTGGPGTGKSTVVRGLLEVMKAWDSGARVVLGAPTGRAAKRLEELSGHPAHTLHRLLGFRPGEDGLWGFARGEADPLEGELLVVDEVSMVDLFLAQALFNAVPRDMKVVLVGDVDQLPSIGPGQVLRDIIASGAVPTVRLEFVFRQAESSGIVWNAHRINRGEMVQTSNQSEDFSYLEVEDEEEALAHIKQVFQRGMQSLPPEEVQVISPMHAGILGVENLNRELQEEVNPAALGRDQLAVGERVFRVGDKVMAVRNNYEKEVFNGNLGRLVRVLWAEENEDLTEDALLLEMDGEAVFYYRSELDEVVIAYAITVHKAQGSEFRLCILPLSLRHTNMLDRNLFYTAVTRGRDLVMLVGHRRALQTAVGKRSRHLRQTGLAPALRQAAGLEPTG